MHKLRRTGSKSERRFHTTPEALKSRLLFEYVAKISLKPFSKLAFFSHQKAGYFMTLPRTQSRL